MSKKLERCVASVIKQGKSESSAFAICNASINAAKKANPKTRKK
jgi:hypothetical protein